MALLEGVEGAIDEACFCLAPTAEIVQFVEGAVAERAVQPLTYRKGLR